MKLPKEVVEQLLDRWPIAHLATIGAEGQPHQVPIVFARVGERLWSPVDGKPKAGGELARVRNIAHTPEVSLLLDDYTADWTRLWWLRVEAVAHVVRPTDLEAEEIAAPLAALRAKYSQYQVLPLLRAPYTLLAFEPGRIESWCASEAAIPEERSPGFRGLRARE